MQDNIRRYMQTVTRREVRIRELGGTVPKKWPWDFEGDLRATQLLEVIEELETTPQAI